MAGRGMLFAARGLHQNTGLLAEKLFLCAFSLKSIALVVFHATWHALLMVGLSVENLGRLGPFHEFK
jgi:hypothetical protein